jgi:putative ABC transport system substrate-binding protein
VKTSRIVYRWAENQIDRLLELAAELVRRHVTVIAAPNTASALAVKALTTAIPTVFIAPEDPVRLGLVASIARPDGNITGMNLFTGELSAKRLELLRAMVPAAARVAVLVNPTNPALENDGQRRQVQVYFSNIAEAIEHIKAGRLRALAITGAARAQALPDVCTIGEFVPDYESVGWLGVVAPKDTPAAIVDMLNNAINAGLVDPKIKQTIGDWGETVLQVRLPSSENSS